MDSEQETTEPKEIEMRDHYDFTGGQRGRYADLFPKTARAVVLAPDVAEVFPDAASVNEALRMLVKAARQSVEAEPNGEAENRNDPNGRSGQ